MSEYVEFINKYPNIDFVGEESKTNKDYSLFQLEAPNIVYRNYFREIIERYKRVYTYNSKLYEEYKNRGMDVVKIPNFPLFDNYYTPDTYVTYEDKIDGICLICRYREKQSHDFDISHKRIEVFESLNGIEKHCYGKIPYCGEYYKGVIGSEGKETYPSSTEKLNLLSKYKFNLCFENAYHEIWSWDYITEKITDCFKAKCVPVYYGCYNIQDRIPKELYIDYRDFHSHDNLVEYMKSITEEQYIEMTEKAFEWEKKTKLGDIKELEHVLWYAENDVCTYFDSGVCGHEKKNAGEVSETYCNDCEYKVIL